MKKRFSALLLALCLLLTVPAYAAQESGGFVRSKTYDGQFSDLPVGSVFYDNVAALFEFGLTVGQADGTYRPEASMTVGQIVIFAGRIRSLYLYGDAEIGPSAYAEEGSAAAERYLHYLQAEGVLDHDLDDLLAQTASRAQVAHVLAGVLPEEALPAVHDSLITQAYASRRFIQDVSEYTPYYQDILSLYRRGISAGSDAMGTYLPDAPITRGAAAAMLTRMLDPALRVRPQWDLSHLYSAAGATLPDLVEPGEFVPSPSTQEELESALRYMLAQGSDQLVFHLPGLSEEKSRQLMDQSLAVMKDHCEQGYNQVHCTWSRELVTLSFSAAGAGRRTQEYRAASIEAAVRAASRRKPPLRDSPSVRRLPMLPDRSPGALGDMPGKSSFAPSGASSPSNPNWRACSSATSTPHTGTVRISTQNINMDNRFIWFSAPQQSVQKLQHGGDKRGGEVQRHHGAAQLHHFCHAPLAAVSAHPGRHIG